MSRIICLKNLFLNFVLKICLNYFLNLILKINIHNQASKFPIEFCLKNSSLKFALILFCLKNVC